MKTVQLVICQFVVMLVSVEIFGQSPVTIDPAIEYQTITGFGGAGLMTNAVDYNPYLNYVVDLCGITMLRYWVDFNGIDSVQDITNGTYHFAATTKDANYFKELKRRGVTNIVATCWSPPACLKVSKTLCDDLCSPTCNGSDEGCFSTKNRLDTNLAVQYGKFLAAWAKDFEIQTTQNLYAISIANEPLFSENFASSQLPAPDYAVVLKAVGSIFRNDPALKHIKLFGPEWLAGWGSNTGGWIWNGSYEAGKYIKYLIDDTTVSKYLDIWAVHGYTDGVKPDLSSPTDVAMFYDKMVVKNKKQYWSSESSTPGPYDWASGVGFIKNLYTGLQHGKIDASIYWVMNDGSFYSPVTPQPFLYYFKHFYRFIRPGYKMIGLTESDADIAGCAFKNGNSFTIELINVSETKAKQAVISAFANRPAFYHAYRSSKNEMCVYLGKITSDTIDLPPSCIVTLHYDASMPEAVWAPSAPAGLDTTSVTETSISIRWNSVAAWTLNAVPTPYSVSISGYVVYIDGVKKTPDGPISKTSFTFTGLKEGTTHVIEIFTRDGMLNQSVAAKMTVVTKCSSGNCPTEIKTIPDGIDVYPNPASGVFIITGAQSSNIYVWDMQGREWIRKNKISEEEKVDISSVPSGLYILKVSKHNLISTKKIQITN